MPSFKISNALSQMGNAVRTFFGVTSGNRNAERYSDLDLNNAEWHDQSPPNTPSNRDRITSTHWPRPASEIATRRRIEDFSSNPPREISQSLQNARKIRANLQAESDIQKDEMLYPGTAQAKEVHAVEVALSAIGNYPDFKESGLQFDVSIGPSRGPKTREEETATLLAATAIEGDPELKNSGVQLNICARPSHRANTDEENFALGLAISAIEQGNVFKNTGLQFDVRIGPPRGPKTDEEKAATNVGLEIIEKEASLKGSGLEIDVRLKTPHPQNTSENNVAIVLPLSELEQEHKAKMERSQLHVD